jgi:putative ABC transport system permease protein
MKPGMDYLTFISAGIRNKIGRNLAAAFVFALIAANIFSGQYLIAGAVGSIDQGVSRMGTDLLLVPLDYTRFLQASGSDNTMAIVSVIPSTYRMDSGIMDDVRKVRGVAGVSEQLFVAAVNIPDLSASPVNLYGINPATDFTIHPWLQDPLEDSLSPGEVLIGHDIRGNIEDPIMISSHVYTIVGILDPTQSEIDRSIFFSMEDTRYLASLDGIIPPTHPAIAPGEVNALLVRIGPGEDPEIIESRINRLYSPANITVIKRHFSLDPVSQDLLGLPGLLNMISAVMLIAAFPLIALIAAMVVQERQREIGLLRAMGAKKNSIFFVVIAESLVLASAGAAVGVGLSFLTLTVLQAYGLLNSAFQVSFRMPGGMEVLIFAGIAFLVVIAMASLSSVYPAYRNSTMNPFDAINQGRN